MQVGCVFEDFFVQLQAKPYNQKNNPLSLLL